VFILLIRIQSCIRGDVGGLILFSHRFPIAGSRSRPALIIREEFGVGGRGSDRIIRIWTRTGV
jgi:hypothetical protein